MKIAVLSDIHANLEAFEAVYADLQAREPDLVVCLGDLVGYGPDPEGVVYRVRELGFHALLGNHEAAMASKQDRDWLNFQAKENNIITQALLSTESLDYCCCLPRFLRIAGAHFVHGFPPDSVLLYVYMVPDIDVMKLFATCTEQLFFVGHTHDLRLIHQAGDQVVRQSLSEGRTILAPDMKYIVNVGSVGQPRDGDKRAKYLLWDSEAGCLDVFAITYDVRATAEKIYDLGFPAVYADRLR